MLKVLLPKAEKDYCTGCSRKRNVHSFNALRTFSSKNNIEYSPVVVARKFNAKPAFSATWLKLAENRVGQPPMFTNNLDTEQYILREKAWIESLGKTEGQLSDYVKKIEEWHESIHSLENDWVKFIKEAKKEDSITKGFESMSLNQNRPMFVAINTDNNKFLIRSNFPTPALTESELEGLL